MASKAVVQWSSEFSGSRIMKSIVVSAIALIRGIAHWTVCAAQLQQLGYASHRLMRGLTALRRDIVRYIQMRECPTLLRAAGGPMQPTRPHVKHLAAYVALGRETIQGNRSHLGLEFDIELV